MTINELTGHIGLIYIFSPKSRIRPFLRGGLLFSWNTTMKEENVFYRYKTDHYDSNSPVSEGICELDYGKGSRGSVYLGAGVDISHIRLGAFWKKTEGMKKTGCGTLTIAYLF